MRTLCRRFLVPALLLPLGPPPPRPRRSPPACGASASASLRPSPLAWYTNGWAPEGQGKVTKSGGYTGPSRYTIKGWEKVAIKTN